MEVRVPGYLNDFEMAINDGKLKAIADLETDLLGRFQSGMNSEILLGTLSWILNLANLKLDPFLENMNFRVSKDWQFEIQSNLAMQQVLLNAAFQKSRSRLIPCSACFQYPGRDVLGKWILPEGIESIASLKTVLFKSAEKQKFGRYTLSWSMFVEANLLTVKDLILNPNWLLNVKGVGESTIDTIFEHLPSLGFIDHTQKHLQ